MVFNKFGLSSLKDSYISCIMDNLIEKTVIDEDCLKNYKFILYLMYMYMYIVKSQIKNFLTNATVYLK